MNSFVPFNFYYITTEGVRDFLVTFFTKYTPSSLWSRINYVTKWWRALKYIFITLVPNSVNKFEDSQIWKINETMYGNETLWTISSPLSTLNGQTGERPVARSKGYTLQGASALWVGSSHRNRGEVRSPTTSDPADPCRGLIKGPNHINSNLYTIMNLRKTY